MRILSLIISLTSIIGLVSAEETADIRISSGQNYSQQGTVTIKRGGKPAQGVRIQLDIHSSRRHDEFLTRADGSALVSLKGAHFEHAVVRLDSKNAIHYNVRGIGLPFPLLIELPEFEDRKEASLPSEVTLIDNRKLLIMPPLVTPQLGAYAPLGWKFGAPLVGTVKLPAHEGIQGIGITLPNWSVSIGNISPFKNLRVELTNKLADQPSK
ncbi:hypothetical protein [Prosthecobacter sp.]|uniref:hypothetical protein n=1 Tax=Prosthecobacter sp. TaxID=1965333 RepID=UPI003784FD76